jgi:hypothetical protein
MVGWQLLFLLALTAAGAEPTDDPMIRWDCDREGGILEVEMVRPPRLVVTEREEYLLSGTPHFEQCHIRGASWTLLVDIVEYEEGRCAQWPDTTISLLRNDRLIVSRALIGHNCRDRPVLSALRIAEPLDGSAPRIERCTAEEFGGESRCALLPEAR